MRHPLQSGHLAGRPPASLLLLPASFYVMILSYQLCLWYNGAHASGIAGRDQLGVGLDERIPFSPWALPAYLSFFGFFMLHRPLLGGGLRGIAQFRAIETSLIMLTVLSSFIFLWFPAEVELRDAAFPQLSAPHWPDWLVRACLGLYALDASFNAWPSLHVSLPLLIVLATTRVGLFGVRQGVLLWAWLAAVMASVLVLKQHYLWDVISAVLLAAMVWFLWLRPALSSAGTAHSAPATRERVA